MKSFLCKFYIILKFLLVNKSICIIELELFRKVYDVFFVCRIREILFYSILWYN